MACFRESSFVTISRMGPRRTSSQRTHVEDVAKEADSLSSLVTEIEGKIAEHNTAEKVEGIVKTSRRKKEKVLQKRSRIQKKVGAVKNDVNLEEKIGGEVNATVSPKDGNQSVSVNVRKSHEYRET